MLAAAALLEPGDPLLVARPSRRGATRDRQVVALAAAHLAGDPDR